MRFGKFIQMIGAATCFISTPVFMSPEPPLYQIIRGEYEDKIRRYSLPEKIFDVFATTKNEKNHNTLTMIGLLRAICFYNYSQLTDDNLQSFNPEFIKQFMGKDAEFQIYDYFNFIRFLVFDRSELQKFFRDKKIFNLTKDLFKDLMLNYICKDYNEIIRESIGIQSRQFRPSKQQYLKSVLRSADSIFKDKQQYTMQELIGLRKNMMKDIYTFEFKNFRTVDNEIDGVEFARSIVKYARNNQKRKLLRRIKVISPYLEPLRVNESHYVNFHFGLTINEHDMENILKEKGVISQKQMKKVLNKQTNNITDEQVEIFYRLLDVDNSGFIEKREVMDVIESLGYYWNMKSGVQSMSEIVEIRWNNFVSKLNKIHEILMEE